MTARDKGLGAVRTVFANNTIRGGGPAASIDGPYPGAVWRENVLWQTAGPGAMPAGSYVEKQATVGAPKPLAPDDVLRKIRQRQD
jgi:hypothetical protein